MIAEALAKLGIARRSLWFIPGPGALGARMALDYPQAVSGLVTLAPGGLSMAGGVGRYNKIVAMPDRAAFGLHDHAAARRASRGAGARGVFFPQTMPDGTSAIRDDVLLRPARISARWRTIWRR